MEITEISMFIIETDRHREETVYEKEQEICLYRTDRRIDDIGIAWSCCAECGSRRWNAGIKLSLYGMPVLWAFSMLSIFPDSL